MTHSESPLWTLSIKYGSQQVETSLPPSATVLQLQERLQELTGAFVRKQKLIYKGKVLAASSDLSKAGLSHGAKLMLLLSDATAVATQGQQALQQQKKARQEEAAQRVRDMYAQAKGLGGAAATAMAAAEKSAAAAAAAAAANPAIDWQERKRAWEKTAIIALRDLGLSSLPADLFSSPGLSSARVADLSHNRLTSLPASLSRLTSLHTLRLERNALGDSGDGDGVGVGNQPKGSAAAAGEEEGAAAEGAAREQGREEARTTDAGLGLCWCAPLASLGSLTALHLDGNRLRELPEGVFGEGGMRALQVLSVCGNALTRLPASLGRSGALRLLAADDNQLQELPKELGCCSGLQELSAARNRIAALPEELGRLGALRSLRLDGNRIGSVPAALLQGCSSLASLSLHDNPITADQLRSTPGFEGYDRRRVALCNKQLEGGVLQHAGRSFT
ncbi:hypothetical protein Agub_g10842, partial [Astrephomene gubernaculifera]